ncbi:MAG: hypothetical protein A4E58_01044 [Syntrophorhabdus sp. PtaB.Bin006]|nr:MAG: hypothetical protein A4E58_01044 [Syntrophorhabdus sp. PtaB.Bin006]
MTAVGNHVRNYILKHQDVGLPYIVTINFFKNFEYVVVGIPDLYAKAIFENFLYFLMNGNPYFIKVHSEIFYVFADSVPSKIIHESEQICAGTATDGQDLELW